MDLESLANIGEIVGGVAVVVSLVYLAVQVRQNTHAQRTENFSRALDRVAAMQSSLARDVETASLFSKAAQDPTQLAPRERIQFTWSMYELSGAFEFMFLASKTKSIPAEVWGRWSEAVAWWLTFPGVRMFWSARPIPFTESFTAYVEDLMRANPTDPEVTARYQAFIANGTLER